MPALHPFSFYKTPLSLKTHYSLAWSEKKIVGGVIGRGLGMGVIRPTAAKPRYRNPSAPTFWGEGGIERGEGIDCLSWISEVELCLLHFPPHFLPFPSIPPSAHPLSSSQPPPPRRFLVPRRENSVLHPDGSAAFFF